MLDPDVMIAKAKKARALGADIVLGAMHAGDEYASEPNAQQTRSPMPLWTAASSP